MLFRSADGVVAIQADRRPHMLFTQVKDTRRLFNRNLPLENEHKYSGVRYIGHKMDFNCVATLSLTQIFA